VGGFINIATLENILRSFKLGPAEAVNSGQPFLEIELQPVNDLFVFFQVNLLQVLPEDLSPDQRDSVGLNMGKSLYQVYNSINKVLVSLAKHGVNAQFKVGVFVNQSPQGGTGLECLLKAAGNTALAGLFVL
jgi:hypothetical protein